MAGSIEVSILNQLIQSLIESSIHNEIMHDCNRHRKHGYRDKTFVERIPDEFVEEFKNRRDLDIDRSTNMVNNRFPSL
jgi:hypothetical protein